MSKLTVCSAGYEVDVREGSEFLEIRKQHEDLPIKFGCTRGNCGVCAMRVVSGAENLTRKSEHEKATLQKKGLDDNYRLACQCALNGNVTVSLDY
ncbi:MAG: (2Fe-2S)-binding protein [Chlamydiales bacterium]|nr:(2Fe-2S)-binding protein [Chlamydiia bacterium]MCP5506946.1 (2Fe-2S)-binding protein [Chlamydiales bacterium]